KGKGYVETDKFTKRKGMVSGLCADACGLHYQHLGIYPYRAVDGHRIGVSYHGSGGRGNDFLVCVGGCPTVAASDDSCGQDGLSPAAAMDAGRIHRLFRPIGL